jgi:hypothetical protein
LTEVGMNLLPQAPRGQEWIHSEDLKRRLPRTLQEKFWGASAEAERLGLVEFGYLAEGLGTWIRFPGWNGEGDPPARETVAATKAAATLEQDAQDDMPRLSFGVSRRPGETDDSFRARILNNNMRTV